MERIKEVPSQSAQGRRPPVPAQKQALLLLQWSSCSLHCLDEHSMMPDKTLEGPHLQNSFKGDNIAIRSWITYIYVSKIKLAFTFTSCKVEV